MTADRTFLLHGTREPEPESRTITVGPLSVVLQDGNLRTLRYLGHEVLRAVAFLVRDRDWGTCKADIAALAVEEKATGFSVRYQARYRAPSGAHLDCDIDITGDRAGELVFAVTCVSDADFETARAGFTILHPLAGLAGQPVTVEHGDGLIETARWPEQINPWQPFMDIAAITHAVAPAIEAETRFEGDTFEMEDQRNWTDGSYKTYVRPLARPWPYILPAGEAFRQSVAVSIRSAAGAQPAAASGGAIAVSVASTEMRLPEIGVGLRPDCLDAELAHAEVLKTVGAKHLIAHFDPIAGHGTDVLKGYAEIARRSGLKVTLEFAVPCQRPLKLEFEDLAGQVRDAGLVLASLFVSPSVDRQSTPPGSKWPDCPPLDNVYAAARKAFPDIALGGGMLSYFTELNRKRVPAGLLDYISHCTNPIVHAADDLSVMQTFEALEHVVRSTRAIYGDRPYRIGPSTIAMRQNPYGSATKDNSGLSRIPMANVDPRHNGQFGAAWTLAYAATVAAAGIEVLTLSTLAGSFGLIAGTEEPTSVGQPRPLAHVLAALGALSGARLVKVTTSKPQAVLGLGALTPDGQCILLVANITPEPQIISFERPPLETGLLDTASLPKPGGFLPRPLAGNTVELGAYACARIVP